MTDEDYMQRALELADLASDQDEVPVGAVVVQDNRIIGEGFNACIAESDPCAHAEVQALRAAASAVNNYRLEDCTLFVTLEPCLMCCGALLQARIKRLVFGAREPRTGAVVSLHDALMLPGLNHHVAISEGVLAEECAARLTTFFKNRR